MTVQELITKLQDFDPEAEVLVEAWSEDGRDGGWGYSRAFGVDEANTVRPSNRIRGAYVIVRRRVAISSRPREVSN